MKIIHLLPLALAITAHPATTPFSLFKIRASNETSPLNTTQPNVKAQAQKTNWTLLAERFYKREARYHFSDEYINEQSSPRLYAATTPTLPPNMPNSAPKQEVITPERFALFNASLDAFRKDARKTDEQRGMERKAREKNLATFGNMNDCISALGHQKYCRGGVKYLRKIGWQAYKEEFDTIYQNLTAEMRLAALVELGGKIAVWQREWEREIREGAAKEWNSTKFNEEWDEKHNMTGKWPSNETVRWTDKWTDRAPGNWTARVDWLRYPGGYETGYPDDDSTDD